MDLKALLKYYNLVIGKGIHWSWIVILKTEKNNVMQAVT